MSERSATDAIVPMDDDLFELSRGHVAALGLGTFFFGVLAFLVGLQVGRTGTAEATTAPVASAHFVPDAARIDELDRLLREVELARSALPPQIATDEVPLRFPAALTAAPVPVAPAQDSGEGAAALVPPALDAPPTRPAAPPPPGSGWSVQLATHPTLAEAEAHVARLKDDHPTAHAVAALIDGQTWYRVRVGGFDDQASAEAELRVLAQLPTATDLRVALTP